MPTPGERLQTLETIVAGLKSEVIALKAEIVLLKRRETAMLKKLGMVKVKDNYYIQRRRYNG